MKRFILPLLLAMLMLPACQKQEDTPQDSSSLRPTPTATEPAATKSLFSEPIKATTLELPSEALPYWRDAAGGSRPALVLFSIHPFLQPLDDAQSTAVERLIRTGSPDDFKAHGSLYRTDPALVSTQALSAALQAGLFSRVIWVFPSATTPDQLVLDKFREQMVDAAFLTADEGAQLRYKDGSFSGTVRGIPFSAVHAMALPEIEEPILLHLDLGYFKGLYKNEIKSPLYPLLRQMALELKTLNWQVRGVTLSYSTVEGELSLETRFLINRFADLLADPGKLEAMPEHWSLHSEALYTINFFLETKVNELYERAVAVAPEDAAVLYGLALRRQRDGNLQSALELVDRAVAQDPGYAFEYLSLADRAAEANDLATTSRLLEKARPYFPDNPFIRVQQANVMLRSGKLEEGRALVRELQKLPWSPTVHADMPQVLAGMLTWEPTLENRSDPQQETKQ